MPIWRLPIWRLLILRLGVRVRRFLAAAWRLVRPGAGGRLHGTIVRLVVLTGVRWAVLLLRRTLRAGAWPAGLFLPPVNILLLVAI